MKTKTIVRMLWFSALACGTAFPGWAQEKMQNKEITVDSIYLSPAFTQKGLSGAASLLEEKEYYSLEKGILYRCVRQKSGKVKRTEVLNPQADNDFRDKKWQAVSFVFNKDKSKLLLLSAPTPIYRRSATWQATVWSGDKKEGFTRPLVLSEKGAVQEVTFSPDGTKVAYIRNNDLYYTDLASGVEHAVTADGEVNKIRNAHTDWVYEEEFGFTKAYDWHPDSRAIAYLKFDESALKEFEMTIWGDLYPQIYRYKYPKAGEANSRVSLWLYDLDIDRNRALSLQGDSIEYYPRLFWNRFSKELIVYTLNRHQNHFRIWAVNTLNKSRIIYEERNPAYVEINDNLHFLQDGKRMLLTSEKDGYNHIWLFDTDKKHDEGLLLTPGAYDVTEVYGVDEANGRVFFQAAYTSPADRDLMCVGLDGQNLRQPAFDMQRKGGCTYALFNNDFTYMILEHSDANHPVAYYLYYVGQTDEQLVNCLEANNHVEETSMNYGFVEKEFFRIPVPLTGEEANRFMADKFFGIHRMEQKGKGMTRHEKQVMLQAWMMKPAEIGTPQAEGKRYPVLMFLYGGPGSQQVMNELRPYQIKDYAWYQMLVQQGYIVVCVDNRGTGGRGEAFKKCTYLELGKYETQDQIAAARFLAELPYVDASRIGIWGWSYGGFMSSNCLFQGNDVFKAAMAVAPVTNWKYYDNVYTERFMRTPQENPDGYQLNSPIHYAGKLNGAYLLVHGTADDNVHFQNAVDLVTALQNAGKQFDFVMYPNKNHGMTGKEGSARRHLYHKLTDFILKNL